LLDEADDDQELDGRKLHKSVVLFSIIFTSVLNSVRVAAPTVDVITIAYALAIHLLV
jgi:hypothetical protein